jgi:fumarate reductase flavoprotein subunit
VDKSGDTIRWLEAKGVEFELATNDYGLAAVHVPTDMMASIQKALIKEAKELGVKSMVRTSGQKIRLDDQGQVRGVVAVKEDGAEFEIETKSAVIATGGFGSNQELVKKYCPDYYEGMHLDNWPGHEAHSGDGLIMAEAIGAAIADWIPIYHRGGGGSLGGTPWKPVIPRSMPQRMIWVNKKGQRFADEFYCGSMEGNRAGGNTLFMQPDHVSYSLFAYDLVLKMEAGGPGVEDKPEKHSKPGGGAIVVPAQPVTGLKKTLEEQAAAGKLKVAGSLDELAEWIGCDPAVLKAEIATFNASCDKGRDEMFAKNPEYLVPLRTPPFYGIKGGGAGVGETLGGIKVNGHMAVVDKQGDVIPGVFAAGVIADGHQGQTYCYEIGGCAVGFAVNSGRIAGESAAKYVLGK